MAYLGKTPSQAVRSRYYFTATGGETSLSGTDDNSNTLTFTDGNYVDVALNGVTLVAGTDYNTTTANTIGGLTALVASDVVEVIVYDTFSVFGGNMAANLNFKDNVKAIFGTGSDLQIYHDGINSYIIDNGTGDLVINTNGNAISLNPNGGGEYGLRVINNGAVNLYHDNSLKLATTATGVDVTGGLNTTDFDVIPTSSANYYPQIGGGVDGSADAYLALSGGTSGNGNLAIQARGTYGEIKFYTGGSSGSASTTERLKIDSSGNVNIGSAANAGNTLRYLDISNTDTGANAGSILRFITSNAAGSGNATADIVKYKSGLLLLNNGESSATAATSFSVAGAERMRILSSGGITFNGDTAAANALDDYEEGTWTPALNAGLTPTSITASYTKIGNRVFLTATFSVPTNSTSTAIVLSGIPYTAAENGGGSLAYTTATTVNSFGILVQGSQMFFYKGNAYTNYALQDFSGHTLIFTAQYKTT